MHIINRSNYESALDAVRDVLMMYADMAGHYAGFGHASDFGIRFDPLTYVDAELARDGYFYVDLEFLRAGSAMAVLCAFYNLWCEEQPLDRHPATARYQSAVNEGRLAKFPDIEAVIREAVKRRDMPLEDPWFDDAVVPIYRNYVVAFFKELSLSDRSTD